MDELTRTIWDIVRTGNAAAQANADRAVCEGFEEQFEVES